MKNKNVKRDIIHELDHQRCLLSFPLVSLPLPCFSAVHRVKHFLMVESWVKLSLCFPFVVRIHFRSARDLGQKSA